MTIHERLKEERLRLGHTQTSFAALCGATKQSQINWEQGVAQPNAGVLAEYAQAGADVLYILTGQRSQALPAQAVLPPDERIMLDNYRHAPAAVQAGIKTTLGAFAPGASLAPAPRPRAKRA